MTMTMTTSHFRVAIASAFRRDDRLPSITDRRPVIVPVSPTAKQWLKQAKADGTFARLFGPLYKGAEGSARVGSLWMPAIRFAGPGHMDRVLGKVEAAFEDATAVAVA